MNRPEIESFSKAKAHGFSLTEFSKHCVDFHWHFHPELELTFIERGKGTRAIGGVVQPYSDGDLCLIGSNLPHSYGSHPRDRDGANWTAVHLQPDRFGAEFWKLPQNHRIQRLLTDSGKGIYFPNARPAEISEGLGRIARAPSGDLGTIYLLELLAHIAALGRRQLLNATPASYSQQSMDQRIPELLGWLEERAEFASLSQSEAATRLHLSPPAFSRYFRQHLGKTFHEYVTELRVARACSKLMHSDAAVSEIAFETGFNNLANFNRRFREVVKCTPTEYRAGRN